MAGRLSGIKAMAMSLSSKTSNDDAWSEQLYHLAHSKHSQSHMSNRILPRYRTESCGSAGSD